MTKIWPIAVNAFIQTIRQPIFSILLLVVFGMFVLVTATAGFSMQTDIQTGDTKLMVDASLATLMAFAIFLAVFSASAVLSSEIESRTVLTVVTKPVSRVVIFLGKLLGVAAAVTIGYYIASTALIFNARHGVMAAAYNQVDPVVLIFGLSSLALAMLAAVFCNYFFNFNAGSTFTISIAVLFSAALVVIGNVNSDWTATSFFLQGINLQILRVLLLVWMATMIMTTMAVAASTRLSGMATLGVCLAVYLLSLMTENIFKVHADTNLLSKLAWLVSPNLTYLYALDTLTTGQHISGRYLLMAAGYSLCYCAALAFLGMGLFQTREMDSREGATGSPMLVNFYAWALRIVAAGAAIAALALLGGEQVTQRLPMACSLLVGGLVGWYVAGAFGRGVRWTLWLVVLLTVAQFVFSMIVAFAGVEITLFASSNARFALAAIASVNLLYCLAMAPRRSTRAHFSGRS